MRGLRRLGSLVLLVPWSWSCATESGEESGVGGASGCVPGKVEECACPGGGPKGTQSCNASGTSFGECTGCGSGSGGGAGWPGSGGAGGSGATGGAGGGSGGASGGGGGSGGSGGASCPANHCTNGSLDCDEKKVDCGGTGCPACPYEVADCVESPKNGNEICDDQAFQVGAPGNYLLVCLNHAGGTIYVASNTGPKMTDGISRCQGWETNGQNAWDHLQYIQKLVCDSDQKQLAVDLTSYVGQNLWMGAHDAPAGGGHNTQSCLVKK